MSQVQELREAFLKEVESKGESSVHPSDLARVKTDDNWVERFLLHHDNDVKMALEMMLDTMNWRREFKVNEINEHNIRMDYIVEGGFFTRCRDKDGAALFIFKCKKHVKGSRDMEDLKRCVVYWFERLERQEKGKPITIFFDMEGCGLSNMDMEFTKYLIGLFKQYYPYFLNYIIIYEMAWILNAAFKVIKSWLPEKAVQKIKMLKKGDVGTYVPLDQALRCWGGEDDYVFDFVPETTTTTTTAVDSNGTSMSNKKVHFAVDSPTSENPDKDATPVITDGGVLSVAPASVITFVKDGDEYVSTLELQNTDASINVSYKMKTTAPEKFRVRPSAGVLAPGDRATITVTLLPAYQIGGLTKDKFLVMSIPVDTVYMSQQDLAELWKNTSGKNVSQHRLRCAQVGNDAPRNGSVANAASSHGHGAPGTESNQLLKLSASVAKLQECQQTMHQAVRNTQILQFITMSLVIVIGAALFIAVRYVLGETSMPFGGRGSCGRDDL